MRAHLDLPTILTPSRSTPRRSHAIPSLPTISVGKADVKKKDLPRFWLPTHHPFGWNNGDMNIYPLRMFSCVYIVVYILMLYI